MTGEKTGINMSYSFDMKKIALISIAVVLISSLFFFFQKSPPHENIKQETFLRLKEARQNKKEELIDHFKTIQQNAQAIKTDSVILESFQKLRNKNYQSETELLDKIDRRFVKKYGPFYDLLFISPDGFIFHTVKQESDYHKNIFELTGTKLAARLQKSRDEIFINYAYYTPSDEPAAFFVIPLQKNNDFEGWIVLQLAANSIHALLKDYDNLGQTGEIYLVNQNKQMLSDSRFMEKSTALKLEVSTLAVENALRNTHGEEIIQDYRGVNVFSSFEKFDYFGVPWIIIAEIDEDEVLTEYYNRNKKYFNRKITEYLSNRANLRQSADSAPISPHIDARRVDINEYAKAEPGKLLHTEGIATCTAVAVAYPGKFGYLAHISPLDKIYSRNPFSALFLKNRTTDLIEEITEKIMHFDIRSHEKNQLHFVISAVHNEGFKKGVDKILEKGWTLSNIKLLYNPSAKNANIRFDTETGNVQAEWRSDGPTPFYELSSSQEDLGKIVKNIIGYDHSS